jgi:hypothetical protein
VLGVETQESAGRGKWAGDDLLVAFVGGDVKSGLGRYGGVRRDSNALCWVGLGGRGKVLIEVRTLS